MSSSSTRGPGSGTRSRLRANTEPIESDSILSPRKPNNKRSADAIDGKASKTRIQTPNTIDIKPVSPGSKENDQNVVATPVPKRKKNDHSHLNVPTSLSQPLAQPKQVTRPPMSSQPETPAPPVIPRSKGPVLATPSPVATSDPQPISSQPSKRPRLRDPRNQDTPLVPAPALQRHQEIRQDLEADHYSSGIIKSIKLYNFMCHESFSKEWHSNLNFITGENGSGKSALLSGLIIGLGARALSTSRTKSIKSLIKSGADSAKIEITLLNNGDLNTNKYGKEIMIQRVIDRNGSSTYRIDDGISRTRKMRALRRTELDQILRNCCILLDNPVTILNQETARSFLKTKDPKDKYQLFYKGTNLDDCTQFLKMVNDNIKIGSENLKKVKEVLLEYKAEVNQLQKQKEKFEELDKMGEKIAQLNLHYHWSLVKVDESKENDLMQNLETIEANIGKLEAKIGDLVEYKKKMEEEGEGSPEEKEALLEQLRGLGKTEQEIGKKLINIQRTVTEAKTVYRQNNAKQVQLLKAIEVLENKITDLTTRGAAAAEESRREYEERKELLAGDLEEAHQVYNALLEDLKQFRHGSDNLKQELHQLEDQSREIRSRKLKTEEDLRNLSQNNSAQNRYAAYGRPMQELMASIEANKHKFRKVPHGPFGACIIAKSEKWAKLIEFVLRDKLMDFVVDNADDAILLNQLIKRSFLRGPTIGPNERRRPTVMVQRFRDQRYDVSKFLARTQNHPTIYDMIEPVDNDVVILNALVDSASIERILLFEKDYAATELLKERTNPIFPRTCTVGYTLDQSKITPDPRFRMDPINLRAFRGGVVRCSNVVQLRMLKQQVLELDQQLRDLAPELDEKRKSETEFRTKFLEQERMVNQAKSRVREVKLEIDSLTRQVQSVKDPDIASFAEELSEKKEELESALRAKEENKAKIQDLTPNIETLNEEKSNVAQQIESLKVELSTYDDRREANELKIRKIENAITKVKTQLRSIQHDDASLKRKLQEVKGALEKHTGEAEACGERVETNRTPQEIQREVTAFSEELREAREHAGDKDIIISNLRDVKLKFDDLNKHYSGVCEVYKVCKQLGDFATHRFANLKESMSNAVMGCFHALIASRGYRGKLLLDHEKKELYYFIYPDGEADDKTRSIMQTKNPKTIRNYLIEYASGLSGGERSFSTICFIIALWQVLESPFYMLDEFDVFMDAFNRKASQNALISHALAHKGNQFFFFTPLDLTEMPNMTDDKALITRMFPPVRTDDTLPQDTDSEDVEATSPPSPRARGGRRGRKP